MRFNTKFCQIALLKHSKFEQVAIFYDSQITIDNTYPSIKERDLSQTSTCVSLIVVFEEYFNLRGREEGNGIRFSIS